MNNLIRKIVNVLVLSVAIIFSSKLAVHAAGNLPQNTPVWFDAEYYASIYPDVYAIYGANAEKYGGFDSAMWFHYKNYGVNENRIPAASPDWFDASYYASAYPDVVAVYGVFCGVFLARPPEFPDDPDRRDADFPVKNREHIVRAVVTELVHAVSR